MAPTEGPIPIAASSDDTEEHPDGGSNITSSDLELGYETAGVQWVGLRFLSIDIDAGSTIDSAYIQFTADATASTSASPDIVIYGEVDDTGTFSADPVATYPLSDDRTKTTESVDWLSIPTWSSGEKSADTTTPNLADIVQEIIDDAAWSANNAMVFLFDPTTTGTNERRNAESYDGSSSDAAELTINWTAGGGGGGPTEIEISVGAGVDDAHIDATYFYNASDSMWWGQWQTDAVQHMFMRFDNITVPIGATIVSAYLSIFFKSRHSGTDDLDATVYAENDADAAAYADYDDWDARSPTTASVAWELDEGGAWSDNTYYDSPDLKTIVQEIVDLGGWDSGNAILLYLEDEGPTPVGNESEFEAYDDGSGSGNEAYLTITYSTSTGNVTTIFMQLIAG